MIQELIVTTQNSLGVAHLAPMGIHVVGDDIIILPFRPSTTLNNLLETKVVCVLQMKFRRDLAGLALISGHLKLKT